MKKAISLITLSLLAVAFVAPVFAETSPNDITSKPAFDSLSGLLNFINQIINWLFTGLLVVAVIFILLAAFQFLTNGGDDTKIKEAQKKLMYALIAVVIGALAKGLVLVVCNLLGSKCNF